MPFKNIDKRKEYYRKYYREYYYKNLKVRQKQYEYNKTPKMKAYRKIWIFKNPDKIKEYYKKSKQNPKRNKYLQEYEKRPKRIEWKNRYLKKYYNIPKVHIKRLLRTRVINALKRYSKIGKIRKSRDYNIDYEKIINHLKPFPRDISKYHIDHIRPLCSFDLNNQEEIKKAFAPENHQWLIAHENQIKYNKMG